ncbi:TPA: GTPase [Escherichia coli]|nr:GTPase [Escherichia coli]MBA7748242.1 50S ribosome-binding GTPase [Escherichia coli]MBL6474488.1 50S ribosome-binding GTPase [Escherichia coli]MBL6493624.1 50S ribosome-binding GTPase [Escherichia coli]MBL6498365.1 50S ribosome-binding GTPase [Escherichia coli]MBL6532623.1 50S ribosome-binding GTPase [Escherichia coli]
MNNQQGLQPLNHSLSGLPQWVSERILQQVNQLTHYEPVIGIMGKTGAGKSSLCNALFAGEVSPVSDVAACTRVRVMAERMIKCLPREASSPVVAQLQHPFRTAVVREQARSDFGETVGAVLDSVSAFPLIPAPVRVVIQAVRIAVVSVARAVWDFFF